MRPHFRSFSPLFLCPASNGQLSAELVVQFGNLQSPCLTCLSAAESSLCPVRYSTVWLMFLRSAAELKRLRVLRCEKVSRLSDPSISVPCLRVAVRSRDAFLHVSRNPTFLNTQKPCTHLGLLLVAGRTRIRKALKML